MTMAKLDKTLAKSSGAEKKPSRKKVDKSAVPFPANTKAGVAKIVDISEDSEIDIRLDKDLSDFNIPSNKSLYSNSDLDIDLTGPLGNSDGFVESQLLDIDPVKAFSRHVQINLGRLSRNGYIQLDNVNTPLSHSFRVIKRPLLNNILGKGATVVDNSNLIMLTSSVSGEGKTFSAINLALSMAMEKDKKILLVDADISKPSHHEIFGVEMESGITDFLTGRVSDVSKIINKTNVPSLSLMFAGSRTEHSVELFASEAMNSFMEELSGRYEDRVIIFDSAPLLLPTEASVLASHMGQVIIVVEAEYTSHDMVRRSIDMLDNRIVLLVLNKVQEKSEFSAYGYGSDGYNEG